MLETNIDDMNPEIYGYIMEKAFEMGALDVFFTPIIMKKNRPGILLSILCKNNESKALEEMLFKETTTFGVRRYSIQRNELERQAVQVDTKYGKAPFKIGLINGKILKYAPEYDFCRKTAMKYNNSIQEIYHEINDSIKKYIKRYNLSMD